MSNKTTREIFQFILNLDEEQLKVADNFISMLITRPSAQVNEPRSLSLFHVGQKVTWTQHTGHVLYGRIIAIGEGLNRDYCQVIRHVENQELESWVKTSDLSAV